MQVNKRSFLGDEYFMGHIDLSKLKSELEK